jgi:hypothetical protein
MNGRACELMKETFFRRTYVWVAHLGWLALYGLFWWLFIPDPDEMGRFILVWGGCFLPLALSAGIFGDDIASGRICVLVTRPFWLGELYIYRLLGLSLQAAVHLVLAGGVIVALHVAMHTGRTDGIGLWLVASWLLFNTWAALSTTVSVVVNRAFNSLLLLVLVVAGYSMVNLLMGYLRQVATRTVFMGFIRYFWPPFELLHKFARGEYGKYALTVGPLSVAQSVACVLHSLVLTVAYCVVGIVMLGRRQFSRIRD